MTCGGMRYKFYSLIRYNFLNDFIYIFYFICIGNKFKCAPIASATIEFVMKLVVFACDVINEIIASKVLKRYFVVFRWINLYSVSNFCLTSVVSETI